jgi:hypothetical protein
LFFTQRGHFAEEPKGAKDIPALRLAAFVTTISASFQRRFRTTHLEGIVAQKPLEISNERKLSSQNLQKALV